MRKRDGNADSHSTPGGRNFESSKVKSLHEQQTTEQEDYRMWTLLDLRKFKMNLK